MLDGFQGRFNLRSFCLNLIICQILLNLYFFQTVNNFEIDLHPFDPISEVIRSDVFFEIIDPEELAYTYKIRPAQNFGTTFNQTFSAKNVPLVPSDPPHACTKLLNSASLKRHVALVERGECSFLTKTINVESAGALAVIVSDYDRYNDEGYVEMVDDSTLRPANIPAGFLLGKNGFIIKSTLKKLNKKYALINLPVNLTNLPLGKFNQPPWVGW